MARVAALLLGALAGAAGFVLGVGPAAPHCAAARASPLATATQSKCAPLYDQILVSLQSAPAETKAGILLPSAFVDEETFDQFAKPEPRMGTIVAMGPGAVNEANERLPMPDLRVGQEVLIATATGVRVEEEGKPLRESTLHLFKPNEVWCKVDPE